MESRQTEQRQESGALQRPGHPRLEVSQDRRSGVQPWLLVSQEFLLGVDVEDPAGRASDQPLHMVRGAAALPQICFYGKFVFDVSLLLKGNPPLTGA